jgi:hypothetical protein
MCQPNNLLFFIEGIGAVYGPGYGFFSYLQKNAPGDISGREIQM